MRHERQDSDTLSPATQTKRKHLVGGLSQGANKQKEGRVSREEHDGRKERGIA